MSNPKERSLNHQYFIRAPREAVFRAISDPEWLARWLCDRAEMSPATGSAYLLEWKNGPTHRGKVVEFLPEQRVSLSWSWPGVSLHGTVLTLSVEAADGGTLLRVEHTGFPRLEQWTDVYAGAEWGWTYFAMNLKSVLETGHDLRSEHDG
jgi:uncharacterized protein YndB with AHSA1/START domain